MSEFKLDPSDTIFWIRARNFHELLVCLLDPLKEMD